MVNVRNFRFLPCHGMLARYMSVHLSVTSSLSTKMANHRVKTPPYPVMCQFQLFVVLRDHNPPALQIDGDK